MYIGRRSLCEAQKAGIRDHKSPPMTPPTPPHTHNPAQSSAQKCEQPFCTTRRWHTASWAGPRLLLLLLLLILLLVQLFKCWSIGCFLVKLQMCLGKKICTRRVNQEFSERWQRWWFQGGLYRHRLMLHLNMKMVHNCADNAQLIVKTLNFAKYMHPTR